MSQVTRWDQQLQQLEKGIIDMMTVAANAPDPMAARAIVHDRDEVDQSLARITIDADKIFQHSRKVPKADRANAALVYWAKQLGVKVKSVASEYVGLHNRKMWLRLLQARFSGTARGESLDLEAKHLVDLAIRKRQFEELEKNLLNDLQQVAKEREMLKAEYEARGTADENWSASGSFQSRLGVNFSHARENPSVRALSDYLRVFSVPSIFPEDERFLRSLDQDLRRKSGRLAEQCKDLATAMAHGTLSGDKIGMIHFNNTIEQVASLRDTVVRKFASLRGRPARPTRPKLVQNPEKTDRTAPHP
jgi:hypothetical protein